MAELGPPAGPAGSWSHGKLPGDAAGAWIQAMAFDGTTTLRATCTADTCGLRFTLNGLPVPADSTATVRFVIHRDGAADISFDAAFRADPASRSWQQQGAFNKDFADAFGTGNWMSLTRPDGRTVQVPLLGAEPARAKLRSICGL